MTYPIFIDQQAVNYEIWEMAMQWVSANRKLVRQIASPYFTHMAADSTDLYQEATISAFKAFIAFRKKGKSKQFVPFFRVIFKTNCVKLASGIRTVHSQEDYHLPCPEKREEVDKLENCKVKIEDALKSVTKRQREICTWLLQQPDPVSTPDIAKQFKVSRRHACRLISTSIQRISMAAL